MVGEWVIFFVDNNSARDGLIRGYSPVLESCRLIGASSLMDAALCLTPWYERVPSASNVADDPSRLDYAALEAAGAVRSDPDLGESEVVPNKMRKVMS